MLQRSRWATALSCRCNVLPVHWTGGVASPADGHCSPLCDAVAARELARMLFVRPRRFLSVSHADLAGLT
jgi:hypothetical protein